MRGIVGLAYKSMDPRTVRLWLWYVLAWLIILQLSGHNQHHEDSDSYDLRLAEYYQAQDRILYSWH